MLQFTFPPCRRLTYPSFLWRNRKCVVWSLIRRKYTRQPQDTLSVFSKKVRRHTEHSTTDTNFPLRGARRRKQLINNWSFFVELRRLARNFNNCRGDHKQEERLVTARRNVSRDVLLSGTMCAVFQPSENLSQIHILSVRACAARDARTNCAQVHVTSITSETSTSCGNDTRVISPHTTHMSNVTCGKTINDLG